MKGNNIYDEIAKEFIESIEKTDQGNYKMPWQKNDEISIEMPKNHKTNINYSGINMFVLFQACLKNKYKTGRFLTMLQCNSLNGRVIKGSKSTRCIRFLDVKKVEEHPEDPELKNIKFYKGLKKFYVFNVDQTTLEAPPVQEIPEKDKKEFFKKFEIFVDHAGDSACSLRDKDTILMPDYSLFSSSDAYYSVLAHELIHLSGNKNRLNRCKKNTNKEELIAEIGAAFLCANVGIKSNMREKHIPYVQSWIKNIQEKSNFLIDAIKQAETACNYLLYYKQEQDQEKLSA